jgi:hypothetical protein
LSGKAQEDACTAGIKAPADRRSSFSSYATFISYYDIINLTKRQKETKQMSAQPKTRDYVPELQLGSRVRVVRGIGPASVLTAIVIRALPNPSQRVENQWYDVKFADGKLGRFNTCFLKPMES